MATHNRVRQQFFFKHDPELKRQVCIQHRNIERRTVVHSVHMRFRRINFLEADDAHRRKNRLHDRLRPGPGKCVKNAAVFIEETERNGSQAKNDRVAPYQRVEKEVRAQPAEDSVVSGFDGRCGSALLRARLGHSAILHRHQPPERALLPRPRRLIQ